MADRREGSREVKEHMEMRGREGDVQLLRLKILFEVLL